MSAYDSSHVKQIIPLATSTGGGGKSGAQEPVMSVAHEVVTTKDGDVVMTSSTGE